MVPSLLISQQKCPSIPILCCMWLYSKKPLWWMVQAFQVFHIVQPNVCHCWHNGALQDMWYSEDFKLTGQWSASACFSWEDLCQGLHYCTYSSIVQVEVCIFGERNNTKTFYSNVDKEVLKILHRKVKSQWSPRNRKWNVTLWECSRILSL